MNHERIRKFGVLTLALPILMGGAAPNPAPPLVLHPLHLSTAQLAVEEQTAFLRIRMFKSDLEAALASAHGLDSLRLEPTPAHDSLFLAYFAEQYEVVLGGVSTLPLITASGEDIESGDGEVEAGEETGREPGVKPASGASSPGNPLAWCLVPRRAVHSYVP